MCPLFFSMDHQNYARYLTSYSYILILLNLNKSHPNAEEHLRNKGFSACRPAVPGARNAIDLIIEETINRQAKCKGGTISFSHNSVAHQKWGIIRHKWAGLVAVLMEGWDVRRVLVETISSHRWTPHMVWRSWGDGHSSVQQPGSWSREDFGDRERECVCVCVGVGVCACEGFKGDECFIGLDKSVIENHRNDSLGHSREEWNISILSVYAWNTHILHDMITSKRSVRIYWSCGEVVHIS